MKNSKVLALVLGAVVGILAVGVAYAAFATTLTINGTVTFESDWNVQYTDANVTVDAKGSTSSDPTGEFTTVPTTASPLTTLSGTVKLTAPGDKVVLGYTISNLGKIDAVLEKPVLKCYTDSTKATEALCVDSDKGYSITASDLSISTSSYKLAAKTDSATATTTGNITAEWNNLETQPDLNGTSIYFELTTNAKQDTSAS